MTKLIVVEDHALVREGLVQTLRQIEDGVEIFAVADCIGANSLLEQEEHRFDLMVLDLGLPGVDGLSCLRTFRQQYSAMPVVILSAYDDPNTVNKAMRLGAAAFVPKAYSGDRLLAVLRDVLAGGVVSPDFLSADSAAVSRHKPVGAHTKPSDFGLSKRQAEVLGLMARGKSNRDIASILGLTEGTVKIHLTAIFKVLGVSSRTQAMVVVARRGIRL
jgi:DNA-binding NarL/FixJ family response regulator